METKTGNPNEDANGLDEIILDLFENHHLRLTPSHLEKLILKKHPAFVRKTVRSTVRDLINQGRLMYATEYSSTYLIQNPVIETSNLIGDLQRTIVGFSTGERKSPIRLADGISFGIGDHPTTRLCLEGLATGVRLVHQSVAKSHLTALDVGTGNGILAIAAALFGCARVVALDTDPVACTEARKSVRTNGFEESVQIFNGSLDALGNTTFDVIMANLRMPTLKGILPRLFSLVSSEGALILSGFRPVEAGPMVSLSPVFGKKEVWVAEKKNWAAIVLQ